MTIATLDALSEPQACEALARCCGASRWVDTMLAARPFKDSAGLFAACTRADAQLEDADHREAFTHHPRIGDIDALRTRFAATAAWAGNEQSGVAAASEATLQALAAGNAAYEARYGYRFIVCATGLSGDELLARLLARMANDPDDELRIAAAEQAKITRLRLEKLIAEEAAS